MVLTLHRRQSTSENSTDADYLRIVFPLEIVKMLGGEDVLNMTLLALNASDYVNGVAKKHGQVSREMFPGYPIGSITNGVHSATWLAESFQQLYDKRIPEWRTDPAMPF